MDRHSLLLLLLLILTHTLALTLQSSIKIKIKIKGGRSLLLDEFVLQGVAGDFHVAAQTGLLPDAPDVGADGFLAQRQFTGDLFDRPAQGDQLENLQLAVGKFLVRGLRAPALNRGG